VNARAEPISNHWRIGAVVLVNKDYPKPMSEIFSAIAEQYDWPDYAVKK
jgi:hypothetical protein